MQIFTVIESSMMTLDKSAPVEKITIYDGGNR